MSKFRNWARAQQAGDDVRGDCIRDLRSDREFPNVATFQEMQSYLVGQRVCRAAIKAGRRM